MTAIAFIVLPSPFVLDQKRNAPLGVMYLASQIDDCVIVDLRGVEKKDWLSHIPEAYAYGISATSIDYDLAVELANMLKADRSGTRILGGAHATVAKNIDPVFDVVVKGEGENAIKAVDWTRFKRMAIQLPVSLDVRNINGLYPAREKLPVESFASTELVPNKDALLATTVIGTRGCPYNCAFCANHALWGGTIKHRPILEIIKEIKMLKDQYGIKMIKFHDDTLTMSHKRLNSLCHHLDKLDIVWRCNTRAKELDRHTARMMKSSGCVEVAFGVEAACDTALRLVRKRATCADNLKTIETAKEAGIPVKAFFMVGLPGDFGDVSGRFIEFCEEAQPDAVGLSTLSPFPGSDIYEHQAEYGIKLLDPDFTKFKMYYGLNNDECDAPIMFEYNEISADELKYHRRKMLEYIEAKGMNKIG